MNYFTRKFTPDLSANHTRFIRKFTPDLFGNLSAISPAISHQIYSKTYSRYGQGVRGDMLSPEQHSFLTISLISELLNNNENQCEIVPIQRYITHFSQQHSFLNFSIIGLIKGRVQNSGFKTRVQPTRRVQGWRRQYTLPGNKIMYILFFLFLFNDLMIYLSSLHKSNDKLSFL